MKERIKSCIDNLKHLPGVYLIHDKDDKIIYIGKAKDLYKRVSQYFLRPQVGKVAKMAFEAEYFETIITSLTSCLRMVLIILISLLEKMVIHIYKSKGTRKIRNTIILVHFLEVVPLMKQLIY